MSLYIVATSSKLMPDLTDSNCLFVCFYFRDHSRVLYIDIDIHHGDGVQVIYYLFKILFYSLRIACFHSFFIFFTFINNTFAQ